MPLHSDKLRLLRRIPDIRFEEETRGYSKDQVDRVLANLAPLADELERMQARLAEAESRAAAAEARLVEARSPGQEPGTPGMPPAPQPDFDETLRNTLVSAQRQADTTVRDAKEEAERLVTEAEFQSNALLADARDQSAEMTTEAVAYRERLMSEAAAERAEMLEGAKDEAHRQVQAVEKELSKAHEDERSKLVDQITDLQENHKLLQADVGRFEQHIASRSAEIRSAMEEITTVLDDPERLRPKEGIEAAEIKEFRADDYPPIAVEVVALNELEVEAREAAEASDRSAQAIDADDLVDMVESQDDAVVTDEVEASVDPFDLDEVADLVSAEERNGVDPPDEVEIFPTKGDPQLGVQTQIIPPPPAVADTMDVPPDPDGSQVAPILENGNGADPFLDELRRVTSEQPRDGDPISDFLEDSDENRRGGGWFGRRK